MCSLPPRAYIELAYPDYLNLAQLTFTFEIQTFSVALQWEDTEQFEVCTKALPVQVRRMELYSTKGCPIDIRAYFGTELSRVTVYSRTSSIEPTLHTFAICNTNSGAAPTQAIVSAPSTAIVTSLLRASYIPDSPFSACGLDSTTQRDGLSSRLCLLELVSCGSTPC